MVGEGFEDIWDLDCGYGARGCEEEMVLSIVLEGVGIEERTCDTFTMFVVS